ncbi:MAG: hypothetical protein ACRET2_17670, partial [Steroidobacteraceae bacterium]
AVPSKAAKAEAAKAGIRERTLQRAVNSLGAAVESRGFPRVTWWRLPDSASDANTLPGSLNLGATGATRHILHKHNGATEPNSQSRQLFEKGATRDNGRCKICDTTLEHPESIAAGVCAECRLATGGAA